MSDIGSDLDAAIILVGEAVDELVEKDERHSLIAYLLIEDDIEREAAWQAILRKFSKNPEATGNVKGGMELTFSLSKYLLALEVALGKRVPEADEQNITVPQEENDFQDSLPF